MAPSASMSSVAEAAAAASLPEQTRRQAERAPLLDLAQGRAERGEVGVCGRGGDQSPTLSPGGALTGATGLMRWRWRAQQRLEDVGWLFKRLLGGEVPGLAAALVQGNPDHLPAVDEALKECRKHLQATVDGLKEGYREALKQDGRHAGKFDLLTACCGNCHIMERDELYAAYLALAKEVQKVSSLKIHAPVKYHIRSVSSESGIESIGKESQHVRDVFDITSVRLQDAKLLHIAIYHDAHLVCEGQAPEFVERLLEAQADVNSPAYYETEATDAECPARRLRTAISPIHVAVDLESVDVVAILLQHGASPETRAVFDMRADFTPLHLAARRGLEGIAKLLIEAGANASETDLSRSCCFDIVDPTVRLPLPRACTVIGEKAPQEAMGRATTAHFSGLQPLGFIGRSETVTPQSGLSRGSARSTASSANTAPPALTRQGSAPVCDGASAGNTRRLFAATLAALRRLADEVESCVGSSSSTMAMPCDGAGGGPRASTPVPAVAQLQRCISQGLEGADVNDIFPYPLPEGRFYKKSKTIMKGCLLHYAVDAAVDAENRGDADPKALVRLVLQSSADVHARAHYLTWNLPHTCTALHIAAAGGAVQTTELLLDAGASVEAMVTNDAKPHYTPLLDAASEGHYEVCELLLKRRAAPNVPNRLGRTCLHNAVLDGRGDLARLLTEHGSDVTLADSIFQETPLLCTIRAKEKYPVKDMLWLCRAYRDSRCSLLYDLSSLAVSRGQLSVQLLDFVLSREKDEANWLTRKKEQMLNQLRRVTVEGKPDEDGLTPVDHLATIIESAPHCGVRLFDTVLCVAPDVQDIIHGTLPVYANLRTGRDSWLPWRRWMGTVEPMLTDYQPDVMRRKDGREWPCWLFNSNQQDAEPGWHRRFARMDSKKYEVGNHMVQMKVLLIANILDAKIMKALGRSHVLEIFAELPIRALLSYVYLYFVKNVLLMEQMLEMMVIIALVAWARCDGEQTHRLCWMLCTAVPVHDVVLLTWTLSRYLSHGWSLAGFFSGFENPFGMLPHLSHGLLLLYTAEGSHSLDMVHYGWHGQAGEVTDDGYNPYVRALLATVIILRSIKLIMLFSYGDTFGTGILAVYNAFQGVFTMLSIMIACFAAFAIAFFVMRRGEESSGDLLVTVYRGLMLGDDDSLELMENMWGGAIGTWLTAFGTAVFTIYLLNIMIAVLTAEYYKADRHAPLILWRERALKSAQVLLGPVFPWCKRDVFQGRAAPCSASGGLTPGRRGARNLATAAGEPREREGTAAAQEAADALRTRRMLDLLMALIFAYAVSCFLLPLHPISGAVALGIMLIAIRARLMRSQSWGAEQRGRRFYLWVCHRSDYSRLTFVSEEVEKEHVDELKRKMDGMEVLIQDMHRRMLSNAEAEASRNMRRTWGRAHTSALPSLEGHGFDNGA